MNFFRPALLAVTTFALVIAPVEGNAKKPKPDTQIKFATLAPGGSPWMKTMDAIDDEIRATTENRVGFKFYSGGVQGDEKDVLRKMRNNQLQAGGFTGFGLGTIVPEMRVMELPFLYENLDELDHVRDALDELFVEAFDKKGYVLLGWADVGFIHLYSKSPIRTPDDLQSMKMWIWSGDPLAELFFKAFKISPIPLTAPDVLTALQTGIIDAVYSSPLACIALQWFTRVEYMTDVPITYGMGAVLVTKKALAKVSAEDQAALVKVSRARLRSLTLTTRKQNIEAIAELKKEGVQLVEADAATHAAFFRTGRAAWPDGVGKLYSRELLDRVVETLETYRGSSARGSSG